VTDVFFQGLPHGTEEVQLKAMFAPCGDIISVRVLREADGSPKGVGFVRFDQVRGGGIYAGWRCFWS
jgi:RNA recognition motif-containing protein